MATIQDFREQVQFRAAVLIHSTSYLTVTKRVFREAMSGYTDVIQTPVQRVRQVTTVDSLAIFRVDPDRVVDALRAGEKAFQLRLWLIEHDLSSDANSSLLTAGVEIQVHRRVAFPDEEYLYTSDEMLANMEDLLEPAGWTALSTFDSFADGDTPSIDSVPEIENDILSYTVEFSAVVAPN